MNGAISGVMNLWDSAGYTLEFLIFFFYPDYGVPYTYPNILISALT